MLQGGAAEKSTGQPLPVRKKLSFWRKLGGGSLSISVILHVVLLALGAFWVLQIIPSEPKKVVDFMPTGGGGGDPAASSPMKQKQRASMTRPNMARVVAEGTTSSLTLPEMEDSSQMASLGDLGSSGLSKGLGGSGAGGGKGSGTGKGFGDGMGPGLGQGGGNVNPFGMIDPNANALTGTFYNLNYDEKGEPLETDKPELFKAVNDFVTGRWRDSELARFQKAPRKLYQSRIYMPAMDAAVAPAAFSLTPDPHPRWIVVYRGTVAAPFTGKFRFVGAGDDSLAVRFNGKNVFDYGWIPATAPLEGFKEALNGSERLKGAFRNCPMQPPVTFYQFSTTANWNQGIGGIAAGPEIEVTAGKEYPVEILISEGWGGLFGATLLIQESTANYAKTPEGAPIFPLFRTESSLPEGIKGDNLPPYDPKGPVWRVTKDRGAPDI
jgi:hypothetical protein